MESKKPAPTAWMKQCSIGLEVRLERQGTAILGPRRAELLEEISQTRSISAAARKLGISYRHAWLMVQDINQAAGATLVESTVGGRAGGGARLTEQGRIALKLFSEVQSAIRVSAVQVLPRVLGLPFDGTTSVHLLAAVSLQEAVGQLLAEFALKRPAIQVSSIFGASNQLAEHILAGAPADLFITADDLWLERLKEANWLASRQHRAIGSNRLSLVAKRDVVPIMKSSVDLKKLGSEPIAIADPSSPLGRCTRKWLERVGVYESVLAKAIVADNSRGVVSALRSGCARMGIVFRSDAAVADNFRRIYEPSAKEASAAYVGAVLNRGQRQNDAEDLLEFMTTAEGQRCLRRCGIEPIQRRGRGRTARSEKSEA